MNARTILIVVLLAEPLAAVAASIVQSQSLLRVVPSIDFARYAGQWYEIARLPNSFQKRCAGEVVATYTPQESGKISVVNRCRLESGEQIEAEGVARLAKEGQPNSMLKVRFAPSFLSFLPWVWGNYQIMVLSPDYTYALVGDPGRKYLWILSRSPQMDEATYNRLIEEARSQGFNVSLIQKTRQRV